MSVTIKDQDIIIKQKAELLTKVDASKAALADKKFHQLITKVNSSSMVAAQLIEELGKVLDLFMEGFSPVSKCSKGCSNCCRIPVEVFQAEAEYIASKTGAKLNIHPKVKRLSSKKLIDPCPFLKDNACSIYEFRPLVCRAFISLDSPVNCENPTKTHFLFNLSANVALLNHINMVMAQIASQYKRLNPAIPIGSDIRFWFPNT